MTRTIVKNRPYKRHKAISDVRHGPSSKGSLNRGGRRSPNLSSHSSTTLSNQERPTTQEVILRETTPVHDSSESGEIDILTCFDFDVKFGPYLGLTRLQRWQRAQRLGLDPPYEVRDILLSAEMDLLTRFDLDVRFGPYLGLGRLERWERAERLGLEPPGEVRDILLNSASARKSDNCATSTRTRLW